MMKGIIFDLDQTLIDRTATFQHFIEGQYLRYCSELCCSEGSYLQAMQRFDDNGYKDKQTMFKEVCEHLNLTISSDLLFHDFKQHYGSEPVLFEGVLEILDSLKQQYRLTIITNGRVKAQATKVRVSGMEPYFEEVTISEAVGVKKPAPEIFEHCLSRMGLSAQDCIYIGDNPKNDIEAAIAVGMKGIWVKNRHFDPPVICDGVIDTYSDLSEILRSL